jgi:hypothetical protein
VFPAIESNLIFCERSRGISAPCNDRCSAAIAYFGRREYADTFCCEGKGHPSTAQFTPFGGRLVALGIAPAKLEGHSSRQRVREARESGRAVTAQRKGRGNIFQTPKISHKQATEHGGAVNYRLPISRSKDSPIALGT